MSCRSLMLRRQNRGGCRPVHHDTPDSSGLRSYRRFTGIGAGIRNSRSLVPDIPAEQSLNKAGIRKFSVFFLITALIFSILLADIKVILAQFQGSRYFENYMLAVNTNGCHFFSIKRFITPMRKRRRSPMAINSNLTVKIPMGIHQPLCHATQGFVIRCNKPMTRPNYCISDYFIEDH